MAGNTVGMTDFLKSVDWIATGSWLQAVAGFASAAAILYAARKGADTFTQWRRQRQAERQIAVAERVLTLVYRAKDVFHAIRSPAVFAGEISEAETTLGPSTLNVSDNKKRLLTQAQVVVTRIAAQKELWNEIYECLPLARAFLGAEAEQLLRRVLQERANVYAAAQGYAMSEGDSKFRQDCEAKFWEYAGSTRPAGDEVARSVVEVVQDAERTLLPILRLDASLTGALQKPLQTE